MKLCRRSQWQELSAKALEIAKAIGAGIVSSGGFIGGANGQQGVSTFVISLIFSSMSCCRRRKLGRQGRQVIYGLLPWAEPTGRWTSCVRADLLSFLSGQCLGPASGHAVRRSHDHLRMPYAPAGRVPDRSDRPDPHLWGLLSAAPGGLSLLIDDPWQALWFIVLLFWLLQQIEETSSTPWLVGSSVGLPSITGAGPITLGSKLHRDPQGCCSSSLCARDPRPVPQLCEKPAGEQGSPTGKMAGPPPPPSRQWRSFRRPSSVQKPASKLGGRFYAHLNIFIDKNPCQCYAIFDRIIVIFDLSLSGKGMSGCRCTAG